MTEVLSQGFPPKGEEAKLSAYKKHVGRPRAKPLDRHQLDLAIKRVAEIRGDLRMTEEGNFLSDKLVNHNRMRALMNQALREIALDKTPGYPLNIEHATNKAAIDISKDEIISAAIARLWLWCWVDPVEVRRMSVFERLTSGLMDPSSVFIKDEPHPERKLKTKTFRCICPVSLVDQLVEAVLFACIARKLRNHELYHNGSAVGIGFDDQQMYEFKQILGGYESSYGKPICDDMSGFDAKHTWETMYATVEVDKLTVDATRPHECTRFHNANAVWATLCVDSASIFGGTLYRKLIPGGLNSGSKDTSRRNTLLRSIYSAYLVQISGGTLHHTICNGDDGLTWASVDLKEYESKSLDCGLDVRDLTHDGDVRFCSHRYKSNGTASLESWPKGLYNIICGGTVNFEDASQFVAECRHNDNYWTLYSFVAEVYGQE